MIQGAEKGIFFYIKKILPNNHSKDDRNVSVYLEGKEDFFKESLHVQGAMAAWVQEGLEELFHVQSKDGRW